MLDLIGKGTSILQIFAPLAILALAILTAYGVIKWGKRLTRAFIEISSSPGAFIFALLVMGLFLYIYFNHIAPLFDKI